MTEAAPVTGIDQFTEVHDRHFAGIYRYIAGRLGAQVAEDVAAETFLVAFDRRKEARHYRALSRLDTPRPHEGHENRVVMSGQLGKALARLTSGERDVLLLVALADLGYAEVAEALGISPGTVGSRLTRARKKLTPVLAPEATDD